MSRISRLRSMTLTFSRLSSAFCWLGDSSSSAMSSVKPVSLFARPSSSALPLPTYQFGSTWRRFCHSAPTTSAPAVVARFASSFSDSSAVQPPSSPTSTATRNAFSTGAARSISWWRFIARECSPRPILGRRRPGSTADPQCGDMDFTLRPLAETDAPALDAILQTEAPTTSMALTTRYRHDVYQSLLAQHPTFFGVVAETPDLAGLAGM